MSDRPPATIDRSPDVVDRTADAYVRLDDEFRVVALNDRAERLHECPREELLGSTLRALLSDDETSTPVVPRLSTAMAEGEPVEFETYYEPHDAEYAVRASPTDDGGLDVYYRDVSADHRWNGTLARHASVVEAVNDGVLVVGADDGIELVNGALEDLLDTPRSALVGTALADLATTTTLTGDDVDEIRDAIAAVRAGDARERRLQVDVPGPEGTPRIAELRLVSLPGRPEGSVAGVVRDVTEHREHERVVRSLHEATRELFRAEDSIEACATAVHTGADLLDLQISGIWLLNEERNVLEPVAATAGAHETVGGLPMFAEGEGIAWNAFQRGEVARFDDVQSRPDAYNDETPIRSELIVPIGSHGVLMAGDTEVGVFDETDQELAEILAANTEVVLDRLGREQLLEERATELERQTERLASVERLLTGPVTAALHDLSTALDESRFHDARGARDRVARLLETAQTYADPSGSTGSRTGLSLGEALRNAARDVEGDLPTPVVADEGTLRAEADVLSDLFRAALRSAHKRDADAVQLGLLQAHDSTARRFDGFYLEDDGDVIPRRVREPPFDPYAGDVDVGLELELARLLARHHGWSFAAVPAKRGMRVEITDVTTLSPATK